MVRYYIVFLLSVWLYLLKQCEINSAISKALVIVITSHETSRSSNENIFNEMYLDLITSFDCRFLR